MGLFQAKFLNTVTHFSVFKAYIIGIDGLGFGAVDFGPLTGETNSWGVEARTQAPFNGDMTLIRMKAQAAENSLDGNCVINFRDDGVSVGSVTIPAGSTALQDSGALNVAVANNSFVNLSYDRLAATLGLIRYINVELTFRAVIN